MKFQNDTGESGSDSPKIFGPEVEKSWIRKSKNFGKLVKNRCENPNSLLEIPSILVDVLAVMDL